MQLLDIDGEMITKKELVKRYLLMHPSETPAQLQVRIQNEYEISVGMSTITKVKTHLKKGKSKPVPSKPKAEPELKENGFDHLKKAIQLLGLQRVEELILFVKDCV